MRNETGNETGKVTQPESAAFNCKSPVHLISCLVGEKEGERV